MSEPQEYRKRYEQCVRVCTVFFSALVGFGLKKILDGSDTGATAHERLGCFIAALLLNLRFLFGSANHLWIEYVQKPPRPERPRQRLSLLWDTFWLAVYGVLSLAISYTPSTSSFLFWNMILGFTAAIVAVLDRLVRRRAFKRGARGLWKGWVIINLLHALAALFLLPSCVLEPDPAPARLHDTPAIWAFAGISLILFFADLSFQLLALDSKGPHKKLLGGGV